VLARAAAPEQDEPAHGYLEPRARALVREYVAALRDPMRAVHHAIYVERSFQERAAKQLGLHRRKLQKLLERMHREVRTLLERAGIRDSTVNASPEHLFRG
jgi:DNA-directed RNA polymerase specialized sigma24 family protein